MIGKINYHQYGGSMKNSLNLTVVILLLVVLGCSCPKLKDLAKGSPSTPSATPIETDTADEPEETPTPSQIEADLTMNKYNQLKIGMKRNEVERLLGGPGTEISTSRGGGITFGVYKWEGPDYTSIILSFRDDRIMTKTQVGLK